LAVVAAALVVVAGAAAVASAGRSKDPSTALAPAQAGPAGAVGPTRYLGPQGRVGQFVVHCDYSHSGPNDPIVHKNHTGASHRHDFYGADDTDADSTPASLRAAGTTCNKTPDTAAYWHPTLFDHDKVVVPRSISAYYRAAPGVDPDDVQTIPAGLALIAGDQTATTPQPGEATGWTCGSRTELSDDPPTCSESAPLHLMLTFQDCWDGEYLDSEDHSSHVAYSAKGQCPPSHPVHIPQITMSAAFPIYGDGHDLRLASGNIYSAHGDFLDGWDPAGLQREIDNCIKRDVVCDLASNREEEPLFSYGY